VRKKKQNRDGRDDAQDGVDGAEVKVPYCKDNQRTLTPLKNVSHVYSRQFGGWWVGCCG